MFEINSRFANILQLRNSAMDDKKIWGVLKKIKSDLKFEKCPTGAPADEFDELQNPRGLFKMGDMLGQMVKVESDLHITSNEQIMENMTAENLKKAAEMFLYVNSCPDPLKSWFLFYINLFERKSPDQGINISYTANGQLMPLFSLDCINIK